MFSLGVGMLTRKVGNTVSPVVELTKKDDNQLSLSSNSAFKNTSITFKLGEEFDEETPDGRKVKSLIVQDGNKLVHTQKTDKLVTTIVREFEPEQLKMVIHIYYNICNISSNAYNLSKVQNYYQIIIRKLKKKKLSIIFIGLAVLCLLNKL